MAEFSTLPDHLKLHILQHLSLNDLENFAQVNKNSKELVKIEIERRMVNEIEKGLAEIKKVYSDTINTDNEKLILEKF